MHLTKRNLILVFLLAICTFGIYPIYWIVVTKRELNKLGAHIPTAWLFIIPLLNIYFLYRFAEGFATIVLKNRSQKVAYFLLILLLFPIGMVIYQDQMNKAVSHPTTY